MTETDARRVDRVVVFCLSLETVKVVDPVDAYKADRAHMLYLAKAQAYRDFKAEVESQLEARGVPLEATETEVWDFASTLKAMVAILRRERGHIVYVNVDGPGAYPAAAMVASMMEGASPFFAKTLEQHVPYRAYYKGGRPVGRSSKVAAPEALPTFALPPPDDRLARGLAVWVAMEEERQLMSDRNVMARLRKAGIELPAPSGGRGGNAGVMLYRRRFLKKWIDNGWLARDGRGSHRATGYGRVVARVFGEGPS